MNNGKTSIAMRAIAIGMVAALVLVGTAMGEVSRTLIIRDSVDIGSGYVLMVQSIDAKASPRQVWLELSRDGNKLENIILSPGESFNYTNIFTVRIEGIYEGATNDMVKITYTPPSGAQTSSTPSPTITTKTTSSTDVISRTGLVAEYHFDGNARDSGANGNDGTISGAKFVQGISGQALSFDGINDYAIVSYSSSLGFTKDMTVEAWIKTTDSFGGIAHEHNGGGDGNWVFGVSNGKFRFGRSANVFDSNTINDGVWHQVVGIYDDTNNLVKHYIDGVEVLSQSEIASLPNYNIPLIIGDENNHLYQLNAIIDEVRIYNRALSAEEIKAIYEGKPITSQPTSVFTPALPTQTITSPSVSSSFILEKAGNYKVLLDSDPTLLDSASLSRGSYYIVSYSNLLPYAGGIEVLASDGKKITSASEVEPVFTSIAWKEASSQLKPSDIQTLRDILQTSKDIDSSVSPVISVTGPTVSSINSLKSACVSIPFVGKKCAWDAVSASVPGIDTLASQLESLNSELNQWKSASSSVQQHLPSAISGIEQAKGGGDINPQLQSEISQSLSAFGTLQSKTSQMSGRLSSISSSLASAESGLRSAASTPVVGSLISPVADAVGSTRSQVDSLKGKADSFSSSMGEQSSKLSSVTNAANSRASELKGLWNARQGAETRVYGTIFGGIGILILVIVIILVKKKKLGTNAKKEENIESKLSEPTTETAQEVRSKLEMTEPTRTVTEDIRSNQETKIESKPAGITAPSDKKIESNSETAEITKPDAEELNEGVEKTKMLLEKLEERFASGEISDTQYNKLYEKYRAQAENLGMVMSDKKPLRDTEKEKTTGGKNKKGKRKKVSKNSQDKVRKNKKL